MKENSTRKCLEGSKIEIFDLKMWSTVPDRNRIKRGGKEVTQCDDGGKEEVERKKEIRRLAT